MDDVYLRGRLDSLSGSELVIESFLMMAGLVDKMKQAFQDNRLSSFFELSEQVRKILAILEVSFKEQDPQASQGLLQFLFLTISYLNQLTEFPQKHPELFTFLQQAFETMGQRYRELIMEGATSSGAPHKAPS